MDSCGSTCLSTLHCGFLDLPPLRPPPAPAHVDTLAGRLSGALGQPSGIYVWSHVGASVFCSCMDPCWCHVRRHQSSHEKNSTTSPLNTRHRGARLGRAPRRPEQSCTLPATASGRPGAERERVSMWLTGSPPPELGEGTSPQLGADAPPAERTSRGGLLQFQLPSWLQPGQWPPPTASASPASNHGHLAGRLRALLLPDEAGKG